MDACHTKLADACRVSPHLPGVHGHGLQNPSFTQSLLLIK